jgi:hypothetical protein
LNGFIGAPGVMVVVYPKVVKVALLPLLALPADEPADDVHAATVVAAVTTASEVHRNLSLREFMNTCSENEGDPARHGLADHGEKRLRGFSNFRQWKTSVIKSRNVHGTAKR